MKLLWETCLKKTENKEDIVDLKGMGSENVDSTELRITIIRVYLQTLGFIYIYTYTNCFTGFFKEFLHF
jgi:hypothetical protein